ncbi:MAG TPA: cytochrome D1 domain-containing protein [Ottowia sp.]|uniref:cytochrome D1 domain-containing protein n=1 Tax=Ottowia sp. TaxID=1898956 RepID=UPI002BC75542|nr:cytochrome D1 domain-containing protein [Ottowia sp.]HMN21852.1 cytochrome D1 domain-containing protein [Ottowia sp.]
MGLRDMMALVVLMAAPLMSQALDLARAERLFAQHCAVCHGADRGGYIGPALNRDETTLSRGDIAGKILSGVPPTLMPQHPSWTTSLSERDRDLLVELIATQPRSQPTWGLEDVRESLQVLVPDVSKLPARPSYRIGHVDDLMAVMSRGQRAAGKEAKVLFYDGVSHRKVGEVATGFAPHLMDFHPTEERWAYVRDDMGWVHKIDLYSMRTVRKVRAGLNGTSLALSRDGRFLAAGSYVPGTMVIMDADTLEPLHLIELSGRDPDGKQVKGDDAGMITGTPLANIFAVALEQAGQVWIVDLDRRGMPITQIPDVGRHLHDAFLSPDGRHLVVSSYEDHLNTVIDLKERRIVRKIPSGCKPHLGSGAVVRSQGRLVGIGTNIGEEDCKSYEVTVFDMTDFEVVKRIPVIGPTESPAAHPNAPYVIVDIVGTGPDANKLQFIDKDTLEVVRTIEVAGTLGHSHFPEYTARGDFFYVSARYRGDRSQGAPGGQLAIFDSHSLKQVKSIPVDVPAGVFSRVRARTVVVGLQPSVP